MNDKSKRVWIAAVCIMLVMAVFPPWKHTFRFESTYSERPAGYSLIISPPQPLQTNYAHGVEIDFARLAIQFAIAAALAWVVVQFVKK